jgi:Ca-activated chloride channel family protein
MTFMKYARICIALAAVCCPPAGALGLASDREPQQQKQDPGQFKIGVEVNMITVPVTVRKPGGGFVKGLEKEDFLIREDGVAQEILSFAQEGVPTRVAIVLDISGSVRPEWGRIKFSTKKFAENLQQEDQFAIVTFNTETRLKMDWGRKLDRIDPVLSSIYCKENTHLWDTVWVVATQVFEGVTEKRAIIIMTDGLDSGSTVTYKESLDSAVRSDAAVYVVSKTEAVRQTLLHQLKQNRGSYAGMPHEAFAQADTSLRQLAYETGGRVLYPNSFGQLDDIYAEVNEELRSQYTIGYVSKNDRKDGSYRRIEVLVKAPDVELSARPGYYAPTEISSRNIAPPR